MASALRPEVTRELAQGCALGRTGRDPAPRAAFALHWIEEPPQLVGIEERGLREADS